MPGDVGDLEPWGCGVFGGVAGKPAIHRVGRTTTNDDRINDSNDE